MENVVCFNVGGIQYKVSCSLLELYPSSMLAQSASEQRQTNCQVVVVFLTQDGGRFKYVLDYLQNNGCMYLQMHTFTKEAFLDDLVFYGVTDVDESKIVYKYVPDAKPLEDVDDVIDFWRSNLSIMTSVEHCATKYRQTCQLSTTIYHPAHLSSPIGNVNQAQKLWDALLTLMVHQSGGQTSISDHAKEECNNYLHEIGLEIMSATSLHVMSILEVTTRQTDLWHGITIC